MNLLDRLSPDLLDHVHQIAAASGMTPAALVASAAEPSGDATAALAAGWTSPVEEGERR